MYIGVIALAVASVSMSVAWYATSRSLYVNSIDILIDADRELEISTSKDEGYTDHLEHQESDATGVFMPVTSAHSSIWMSEQRDMPLFYDDTLYSEEEDFQTFEVARKGFYSQKLYIRSDDSVWVTLDASKTFIHANTEYNKGFADKLYKKYHREYTQQELYNLTDEYKHSMEYYYSKCSVDEFKEKLDGIVSAMRYSILIKDENEYSYTIFDPNKNEVKPIYLGGVLDNDIDQYYDFYKKNGSDEYRERVYGEVTGDESLYDYTDVKDEDLDYLDSNDIANAFNARHKPGVKKFNLQESLDKGLKIKKEEAIDLKNFNSSDFRFPVYINQPKEIVVSIYIEGWDKDSINYTMGAAFYSDLVFKIEREM